MNSLDEKGCGHQLVPTELEKKTTGPTKQKFATEKVTSILKMTAEPKQSGFRFIKKLAIFFFPLVSCASGEAELLRIARKKAGTGRIRTRDVERAGPPDAGQLIVRRP